ncbi:MAG: hypothetical protein J6T80_07820 [Paludibacteraceae bacterium]|nr:hypothetical protein [Paludibacteraceae bacterium]
MKKILFIIITMFAATTAAWAYTAQFHAGSGLVNGSSDASISEASDGAGITLPTPTLNACSNWEFAGWIASGSPYGPTDELTQEIHRAGELYRLSSISEEFYAVYRYKTDRYCEIYVNDQLITGSQYIVVNDVNFSGTIRYQGRNYSYSIQYPIIYPTADGISGVSIYNAYTTWASGYVDINSSNVLSDAQKQSILYILSETDATNHYWSMYNPYTNYYLDLNNLRGINSYSGNADGVLTRSDWNKFTLQYKSLSGYIGFYEDPLNERNFHRDFYILRQQTIFTSTPDCSTSNYTVTLNPGANGRVNNKTSDAITESGYHHGVVLPAATPYTGGNACNALWEFAGWTESGSALATDAAELPKRLWLQGEVYYPERDETLHAVYRRKSTTWEQVEDPNTLQAGEKILIAYNNSGTYYVLSSAESAVGYNASVAKAAGEMNSVDDAALVWTLEGVKGAWRLKDSNGKHLDMTRSDYAYSYTYPWSRWSDEFTVSGETNFSIRSNYAAKNYLTANATKFLSQAAATSNIHIYRQVTLYSKTPKCENYTVLFNSGEGTFSGVKDATIGVENVSSTTGIALNNASVPVAVAPDCDEWKFAGWRVGSGLNATTNAPGVLYTSTDTYVPLQDSITLYAVYQNGDGEISYQRISSSSEVVEDGTYIITNNAQNKAVSNSYISGSKWSLVAITANTTTGVISTAPSTVLWTYNGTYFESNNQPLAYNQNTAYFFYLKNATSPFYFEETGYTSYHLKAEANQTNEDNANNYNKNEFKFYIYKQVSTGNEFNSWPHCSVFTLVLDACGGQFAGGKDTIHVTETSAGTAISLSGKTPTTSCASDGWSLVGWVEKKAVQARNSAPTGMITYNASYHPKQDMDQLYAVYSNGSLWSSYPACGEGIEIVEWMTDGVIVESYSLTGTPSVNGKNGSANGDGTYTLSYDVASNPCVPLLIQWGTTSQIFKTPLLVSSYTRISAVTDAVTDCSTCDLIILNGGTAIADEAKTVRDITVYPGGRFNLASGKSFTASSLTMRTNGDELAPSAVIQGSFGCSTLNHDRRIDDSRYYWMALPYDVTISNINYADPAANNGNASFANMNEDYHIYYYDGVTRAANGGAASTSYWTHINDITDQTYQNKTTLKAGRGYLIAMDRKQSATGHTYRTLRFPMAVGSWSSETSINKTVVAAGANSSKPYDVGWNLIGNPFLQNYSAVSVSDVTCGKLQKVLDENDEWVDPWYVLEDGTDGVAYVTIFNPSTGTYTQTEMIGQNIPPFSAVFVQLASGVSGIHFAGTAVSKNSAPARRMGLMNEEDNSSRISIYGLGDTEDLFTLILDDKYSTAYEVGADLIKWPNGGQTNIYTIHEGVNQVFDALSYADADSIPVGFVQPSAGGMKIYAEAKYMSDDIAHVWLMDNEEHTQTDLLVDSYTLTTDAAGTYNGRLWISIEKRDVPTSIVDIWNGESGQPRKIIINGQLFIQNEDQLYNASGIRVR